MYEACSWGWDEVKDKSWYNIFGKGKEFLSRAQVLRDQKVGACMQRRDRKTESERDRDIETERTPRETDRERLDPFLGNRVRKEKACGLGGGHSCLVGDWGEAI